MNKIDEEKKSLSVFPLSNWAIKVMNDILAVCIVIVSFVLFLGRGFPLSW